MSICKMGLIQKTWLNDSLARIAWVSSSPKKQRSNFGHSGLLMSPVFDWFIVMCFLFLSF